MKKSLILGILGLAAGAVSSYGQGAIYIDNYQTSGPNISLSAGLGGGLVGNTFTMGLYYDPAANVNITGAIGADAGGTALPSDLNAAFILATGPNSTAGFASPGEFTPNGSFLIQPGAATSPVQSFYTLMVVVYNGSTYANSSIRGHSTAFYVEDASPIVDFGADLGGIGLTAFSVNPVPEPTTMALGALGGLGLLLFRRKQA